MGWSGGCGRLVAGSGGFGGVFDGMDGHRGRERIVEEHRVNQGFCSYYYYVCLCSSQPALRLRAAGVARPAGLRGCGGSWAAAGQWISHFWFGSAPAQPIYLLVLGTATFDAR